MEFGFAQVEQTLAAMHSVPDDRRTAFAARLKHLQKLGYPPGTNTGRGRAAAYRVEHAFLLALVLELIQLGYTPERGTLAVYAGIRAVADGVRECLFLSKGELRPVFLSFDPAVLSGAMGGGSHAMIFRQQSAEAFLASWSRHSRSLRRLSIINLAALIKGVIEGLRGDGGDLDVLTELLNWCRRATELEHEFKRERLRRFHEAHRTLDGNP